MCESDRCGVAGPSTRRLVLTHMDSAVEKGTDGQHDRASTKIKAHGCHNAGYLAVFDDKVFDTLLKHEKIGLLLKRLPDSLPIQCAVSLRTRCPDRRALAAIQCSKMDARCIGRPRHDAVERIDFAREVSFTDAAYRGVATHLTDSLEVLGQQYRVRTHSCSCSCSLGTGMAATDNYYIVCILGTHGAISYCAGGILHRAFWRVPRW